MGMLELVAARSTCPRRSVGAILVDQRGRLISTGYNGQPSGFRHCSDGHPCPGHPDSGGSREDCEAVHAETNAVVQAMASRLMPYTLYCSVTPCFNCAKLLCSITGLKDIICGGVYMHDGRGVDLLYKASIRLRLWHNVNGRMEHPVATFIKLIKRKEED
jgi:dCMP deaminase